MKTYHCPNCSGELEEAVIEKPEKVVEVYVCLDCDIVQQVEGELD